MSKKARLMQAIESDNTLKFLRLSEKYPELITFREVYMDFPGNMPVVMNMLQLAIRRHAFEIMKLIIDMNPGLVYAKDEPLEVRCIITHDEFSPEQEFVRNSKDHFYQKSTLIKSLKKNSIDPLTRELLVEKEVNAKSMPMFLTAYHYAIKYDNLLILDYHPPTSNMFPQLFLFAISCKNEQAVKKVMSLYRHGTISHRKAIERGVYICIEKNLFIMLSLITIKYRSNTNLHNFSDNNIIEYAINTKNYYCVAVLLPVSPVQSIDLMLSFYQKSPLLTAVQERDNNAFSAILASGVYSSDVLTNPPMQEVIWVLPETQIRYLQYSQLESAFTESASIGNSYFLQALLDYGVNVNTESKSKDTALFFAAALGFEHCVKLLIDSGADVNHKNNNFETALHAACKNMQVDCMRLLIHHGAKINCLSRLVATDIHNNPSTTDTLYHRTPLIEAIHSHIENSEGIQLLLEEGADPTICDSDGVNPYEHAMKLEKASYALLLQESTQSHTSKMA